MSAAQRPTRLAPEESFPPYTFVPGRYPHPTSDPQGHSFGVPEVVPLPVDPERWQQSREYLYGIDLFNGGFYWESHVAWESLWIACGRKGVVADFLKGLIKLAAAGVKYLEGTPKGVQSHSGRAAELWRAVASSPGAAEGVWMGFCLVELIAVAEAIHQSGWPTEPPVLVPVMSE